MRSLKIIPVILLLVAVSPAYGQTITYSLLSHERQIGPLEQYLYSPQWPTLERTTYLHYIAQRDSTYSQPLIVWPFIGAIVGGAAGIRVTLAIERITGMSLDDPYGGLWVGVASVLTLYPLCMSAGVHLANKRLGSLGQDFGVSAATGAMGFLLISMSGASKRSADFDTHVKRWIPVVLTLQVVSTVLVERLSAAKKLRAIQP